jgi:hypothetical protein
MQQTTRPVKHNTQLWTILQTKNAKSYCGTKFFRDKGSATARKGELSGRQHAEN